MTSPTLKASSPTRTYVAICVKTNFDGYYFRKFVLPKGVLEGFKNADGSYQLGSYSRLMANTSTNAVWYFLNELNHIAYVSDVCAWEDYSDLRDEDQLIAQRAELLKEMVHEQ